jgi:hypothetical protein
MLYELLRLNDIGQYIYLNAGILGSCDDHLLLLMQPGDDEVIGIFGRTSWTVTLENRMQASL